MGKGTTLASAGLRAFSHGFPKVMLSTVASGNVGPRGGPTFEPHDRRGLVHDSDGRSGQLCRNWRALPRLCRRPGLCVTS